MNKDHDSYIQSLIDNTIEMCFIKFRTMLILDTDQYKQYKVFLKKNIKPSEPVASDKIKDTIKEFQLTVLKDLKFFVDKAIKDWS